MSDRLVCAVDATPRSAGVVCAAIALARALGLRIVFVHVAEDGEAGNGSVRKPGVAELERSLAGLPIPSDAIRRIETGDTAELIAATAQDEQATLILTGTRSGGARAKALFHSVAGRVIELAQVPVVIAPPACCDSALTGGPPAGREVIIAVDGSVESRAVTEYVGAMASRARTSVVLAHVVPPLAPSAAPPAGIVPPIAEPDRDNGWRVLDDARQRVPDPAAVELELRNGMPARELEQLAQERDADMIAVGTSRPGRLRRALAGSLADELAAASRHLVMVVPHDVARRAAVHEVSGRTVR